MDESYRAIALARVKQWILYCGGIVPANLALDIWVFYWVNNTAINLHSFFFELLLERVQRLITFKIFLRCYVSLSHSLTIWLWITV